MNNTLLTLVDDCGSASKDEGERKVLTIGAVLPLALADVSGGERDLGA